MPPSVKISPHNGINILHAMSFYPPLICHFGRLRIHLDCIFRCLMGAFLLLSSSSSSFFTSSMNA